MATKKNPSVDEHDKFWLSSTEKASKWPLSWHCFVQLLYNLFGHYILKVTVLLTTCNANQCPFKKFGLFLPFQLPETSCNRTSPHLEGFKASPPLNRMCHIHQIYVTPSRYCMSRVRHNMCQRCVKQQHAVTWFILIHHV